jgi:hypothetical protein
MILIKYDYNREVCEDTNHWVNSDSVTGKLTITE